jgi:DNA (cytosine-5)-methyltransferase 1
MKHLDLFSGYGGFTIPAKKYGMETIGFSEIDKYAIQVLNYHYPNIKNYGDITKIKGEDLPTVDIITGGSPCQDLSVAGKGAGLNGARSGLFFHFIRLIKEKQPTYFVWENVKGAFSSGRGWDFARVQIEMEQAGYDVWWQLLNAKDFGVPQNRERIFAIGTRKGSGREILFERIGGEEDTTTREQVSSTIHAGYYKQGGRDQQYINKIVNTGHDGTNIYGTDGIATTQKALGGGQGAKTGLYAVASRTREKGKQAEFREDAYNSLTGVKSDSMVAIPNSNGNVHALDANYWKGSNNPNKSRRSQVVVYDDYNSKVRKDGNIGSLTKNISSSALRNGTKLREPFWDYGNGTSSLGSQVIFTETNRSLAVPVLTPDRVAKRQHGRRFKTNGEPSFTLTGQDRHSIFDGFRIRRLTPLECERLMGLEDNWTAKGIMDGEEVEISDTQRYKMCGNGVVVNCVDYIYSLLKEQG